MKHFILVILSLLTISFAQADDSQSVTLATHFGFLDKICTYSTGKMYGCPNYVNECAAVAIPALDRRAVSFDALLQVETLEIFAVDEPAFSPIRYIYWQAIANTRAGEIIQIQTVTQKSVIPFHECFL